MKFEIDVDIPEGFEPTGEYRKIELLHEWYLDPVFGDALTAYSIPVGKHIILRRKRPEFVTLENVPYKAAWCIANMDWPAGYWKQIAVACRAALEDRGDA